MKVNGSREKQRRENQTGNLSFALLRTLGRPAMTIEDMSVVTFNGTLCNV